MAAARTQKRASANAGRSSAARGSRSRASASHAPRTTSRSRASGARGTGRTAGTRPEGSRGGASAGRRERGPSATTLFIIASVLFAAWTVYPVLRIQYIEQRNVATLEAELTGLKDRNAELRSQVDELKTPEGVEQIARETLGLVKPGEHAYVVTGASSEATESVVTDEASGSFWREVLDFVFGLR